MKMIQSEIRKALGYCGLFATRETVNEAMEYVHTIADACGKNNKVAVLTAVGVFHNALIDHIVRNYDLVPKGELTSHRNYLIQTEIDGVKEVVNVTANSPQEAIEVVEDASAEYNAQQYITMMASSDTPITLIPPKGVTVHYSVCEACGEIGSTEDIGTTCRKCGGRGVMR